MRGTLLLVTAASVAPMLWAFKGVSEEAVRSSVQTNAAFSLVGCLLTTWLVPIVSRYTERKNLFGYDLNKAGTELGHIKVPEALGLAPGVVYLICTIGFQVLLAKDDGGALSDKWLAEYNAALASICFMLFLGFVDDVLDIPWRAKLVFPAIAALPLVVAYTGSTTIVTPRILRPLLGLEFLTLGIMYKVYMLLIAIFCSNAINIFAGLNGLEAGQTFLMACAVLYFNMRQLGGGEAEVREAHLLSVFLMLPLAATTFGLLWFNWYPSKVFVGDTFTYFAGMTFAVAGVLSHYSETILLFFLPQLVNFAYSLPQLFGVIPCPRHRLPKLDKKTGLLHATPNMNLVNLSLRVLGPQTEHALVIKLLIVQGVCCAGGILVQGLLDR